MMLLLIEKMAQYRGDTSITKQVQNMNNRINIQTFNQNRLTLIGFICMFGYC